MPVNYPPKPTGLPTTYSVDNFASRYSDDDEHEHIGEHNIASLLSRIATLESTQNNFLIIE